MLRLLRLLPLLMEKKRRNRQDSVLDEAEQERLLNLSREKLLGAQPKV
jgi:hypothetical protein